MKNKLLKIFLAATIAVSNLSSFSNIAFASSTVLSQNDFKELLSGYTYSEVTDDGYINVETFTDAMKTQLGTGFFKQFHDREQIVISFNTNSSFFSFEYKKEELDDGYVDVFVDNVRVSSIDSATLEDEGEFSYDLDGEGHRVDVYLPRGGYMVRNFAVDEGAEISPITDRTKALFFGDSITYGYLLGSFADSYVNILARQMNYEVVNLGVGGYYFDGRQVVEQNEYEPDVIFVAYGANDIPNAAANTPNAIATNGRAFLNRVRAEYPTQHIYVITPIYASGPENRVQYYDIGRDAIETLCKSYTNITCIDGEPLMPASSIYLADEVHPNLMGNEKYGNNLAKVLKGEGSSDTPQVTGKGWKVSYAGGKTDRETYFANTTEDANFSSGKSMYIQYPDAAVANTYVELESGMSAPVTAGDEYEITFYLKGALGSDTELYVGDRKIMLSNMTKSSRIDAANVPSGERNWVKYSYTLSDYAGADTTSFKIRVFSNTRGAYLDDVSIIDVNGDNLITDPSFDGIEEVITEVEPFDTTDYQVTRMMASSGLGMVGLSWKNPETSDLSKVSVYNITDGEYTLLSDSVTTAASEVVVYPVTGLTDGKTYIFMLKFDFGNGASFKYYMSCAPGTRGYAGMLGSWTVWEYAGGTATYTPTSVSIDNEASHSGDASMKFILNLDTADDPDLAGNNYIRVYQENLSLDTNTKYEVKMWLKCQEMGNFNAMMDWSNFHTGVDGRTVSNFGGTISNWREYTFTYDTTSGNVSSLNLLTEASGTMWIDDVTMYKLDADGNPTGDNLIADGGFEGLLDASVGDLQDAFASNIGINEMTINWETTSSKIDGINIYEKLFDNWEYRGTVAKGIGSIDIEGLEMGTEYSYKLVPVNSAGVEGEGVEITAGTEMPEYTIKEPVLKKGNYAVTEITGAGSYTVTTEVKNFAIEDMTYLQCVAVYKNGALEKIYPTEKVLPIGEKNTVAQKVNTSFTIEGSGEYSVKVYIFDSILNMNSYIPKTVFE